jgi:hypothetical protein
MLWRDMRERIKEIHKELQDLDSLCSPHLEEKWIGENIDLDLPSLFPKNMQEYYGRNGEGRASYSESTMEEREAQFVVGPRRKKGYLYPLQKCDHWGH